jgi:hypothetical protein
MLSLTDLKREVKVKAYAAAIEFQKAKASAERWISIRSASQSRSAESLRLTEIVDEHGRRLDQRRDDIL